jgi:hypothetical protein
LSGCAAPQASPTWWNPGTWFSGRAGDRFEERQADVRDTQADLRIKQDTLIQDAQEFALMTDIALEQAPESRPVEVARQTSGQTVVALDEAIGATDRLQVDELRSLIGDLLSENAEIRAEGEQILAEKDATISVNVEKLHKAEDDLKGAQAELAEAVGLLGVAFERENALANKYRNIRFAFIGLLVLGVILGLIALYLRFMGMGALGSIVGTIEQFRGRPESETFLTELSKKMNNGQKKFIRRQRARSIKKNA